MIVDSITYNTISTTIDLIVDLSDHGANVSMVVRVGNKAPPTNAYATFNRCYTSIAVDAKHASIYFDAFSPQQQY